VLQALALLLAAPRCLSSAALPADPAASVLPLAAPCGGGQGTTEPLHTTSFLAAINEASPAPAPPPDGLSPLPCPARSQEQRGDCVQGHGAHQQLRPHPRPAVCGLHRAVLRPRAGPAAAGAHACFGWVPALGVSFIPFAKAALCKRLCKRSLCHLLLLGLGITCALGGCLASACLLFPLQT
jgi:hypothetical protein